MLPPSNSAARPNTFDSSRTFPGQSHPSSFASSASDNAFRPRDNCPHAFPSPTLSHFTTSSSSQQVV